MLRRNQCLSLLRHSATDEPPPPKQGVVDFLAKREFIKWSQVFTARFGAISMLKFAFGVGELPFDVLLSVSTASIALAQFQPLAPPAFSLWRKVARLMPITIRRPCLGDSFYTAAHCLVAHREELDLALKAVGHASGVGRDASHCAAEAGRLAEGACLSDLIEHASERFKECPFAWY
jgi:hypothetical protein